MYLIDYLWFEEAILSIHDIRTERFGFMMLFGDISWVPFGFSIHARYLFLSGRVPSTFVTSIAVALQCIGYAIFRISNFQKHSFLTSPGSSLPFCRSHPPRKISGSTDNRRARAAGAQPIAERVKRSQSNVPQEHSLQSRIQGGRRELLVDGLWRASRVCGVHAKAEEDR